MKAVRDPENYCPICGARLGGTAAHRCPDATCRGIDGANVRFSREEDGEFDPRRRSFGDRLQEGFRLLKS